MFLTGYGACVKAFKPYNQRIYPMTYHTSAFNLK